MREAGVAQLVERLTCNEDVAGSTPVSGSLGLMPAQILGRMADPNTSLAA